MFAHLFDLLLWPRKSDCLCAKKLLPFKAALSFGDKKKYSKSTDKEQKNKRTKERRRKIKQGLTDENKRKKGEEGEESCTWNWKKQYKTQDPEVHLNITRPDTRLPKSRAGGQGRAVGQKPYLRSLDHLGKSSEVREKNH